MERPFTPTPEPAGSKINWGKYILFFAIGIGVYWYFIRGNKKPTIEAGQEPDITGDLPAKNKPADTDPPGTTYELLKDYTNYNYSKEPVTQFTMKQGDKLTKVTGTHLNNQYCVMGATGAYAPVVILKKI